MARVKFYNPETDAWQYINNTSGVSKDFINQMTSDCLDQYFIRSPNEPEHKLCLWFDTSIGDKSEDE